MTFRPVWPHTGGSIAYDRMPASQYFIQESNSMDYEEPWHANLDPGLRSTDLLPSQDWNSQKIRYLTESEKLLFTVDPVVPYYQDSYSMNLDTPYEATGTFPFACNQRRRSISIPSQESQSICGSDFSPRTKQDLQEYFQPHQSYGGCGLSRSKSDGSQGLPGLDWPEKVFDQGLDPAALIMLSDVQVFPEPEDSGFQDDDLPMELEMPSEFALEPENRATKLEESKSNYHRVSDLGIDLRVNGEHTPEPQHHIKIETHEYTQAQSDDDDEEDQEDIVVPEADEDQDTEYNPKATRTTQRRRPRISRFSPSTKRSKVTKNNPRSKSPLQCKSCSHSARDTTALGKHVASVHTRAYICAFGFAGCPSTFASKNEWKRHVNSKHLALHFWRCNISPCGGSGTNNKCSEFNRKDLFTQHLRRMHAPFVVKRQKRQSPEWEQHIVELQRDSMKVRRVPPVKARCPVDECMQLFEGTQAWDERMEHVGKHLEKAARNQMVVDQGNDEFLVKWALRERIIERKPAGGFQFCSAGEVDDVDAECEDE